MSPELLIPVFFVIIALVIVGAYQSYVVAKRRPIELAALAAGQQWSFDPAVRTSDPRLEIFAAFQRGHSRCAFNTLYGGVEIASKRWPLQAGDYLYKTTSHSGKHTTTHTHYFSYAIIETPHLGAPELMIRREGMFDRLAGFMGFDDIDFESVEFSERFFVKSSDKRFAYAVLEPRMMEFLMESDPPTIEFRRGLCCLVRRDATWSSGEFATNVDWGREFLSRWPGQVPSTLDL